MCTVLAFTLFLGALGIMDSSGRPLVERVIDGDTVRLSDGRTMRLAGIDCPESSRNAKCRRAGVTQCDAEVVQGKAVAAEVRTLLSDCSARAEVIGTERYGRALGYVWLADGRDLGQRLVATGRCVDWSAKYPHPRGDLYGLGREIDGN
jgi:endonuclease YncB( thermonuclease family)